MPQLPDVTPSFGALANPSVPESARPIASVSNPGVVGNAITTAGQQIGQVADELKQKQDDIDYTFAKSNYLTAAVQAQKDEELNPDYAGAPGRFMAKMDSVAKDTAQGINNPMLRQQFLADQGLLTRRLMGEVEQGSINKFKNDGLARLNDANEVQSNLAANTTSDAVATSALSNIQTNITSAKNAGIITPETAFVLGRKSVEGVSIARAKTVMLGDPSAAMDLLKPASSASPVHNAIVTAAQNNGVDGDTLARTAVLESGGNPSAMNGQSAGLFQFQPDTAKQYGLTNPLDANASSDAAAKLQKDNAASLTNSLGRVPTPDELYLAHQQGAGGAAALLSNPDKNAVEVLTSVYGSKAKAQAAITQNGGSADMTAGQFAGMWKDKFNGADTSQITGSQTQAGLVFPKQGDWRDFIPPEQRMQMLEISMNRSITLENQAAARAERNLKLAQTANESSVFSDLVGGKDIDHYDLPGMLKNQQISVAGFNALQAEKKRATEGVSDPIVLVRAQADVGAGKLSQDDIYDLVNQGKLGGKDALELTRGLNEVNKTSTNQIERGAFNTLKTAIGGDGVEKGMVDFTNESGRARTALTAAAYNEWNSRVLMKKEDPQAVLADMLPRYTKAIPNEPNAWPQPRYGAVNSAADVATVAKATKDAFDAKQIDANQFNSEQQLIVRYKRFYDEQKQRQAATQSGLQNNNAGGAKLRGISGEGQ